MHRHDVRLGAPSRPMDVLILPESEHRKAVGVRLRRLIAANDLKLVQAAEVMGVTKNHLGNWLRGTAYPQHYALYRFCRAAGVNTDYVMLGDPSGLPKRIADRVLAAELELDAL